MNTTMRHVPELPDPEEQPDNLIDSPDHVDLEDVSDEALELSAYLGTPEVAALCTHLSKTSGEDGTEIIKAAFRDGFNAGASAFEDAMNRLDFDHYVVLTEQSGCRDQHRVSLRLTLLDGHLYCSEGFDHNTQQPFCTSTLSPATMQYLFSIVSVHNQNGRLPIPSGKPLADETEAEQN